MSAKQKIIASINEALQKLNISKEVNLTDAKGHADFATNIALVLQKDLGKSAMEVAQLIKDNIECSNYSIKNIEIAKPGFLNFYMENEVYADTVNQINALGENYGKQNIEKPTINVEFVSANPTGFLHIGHARNAAIGATLCNVLESAGHKVIREYYVNDAGNQMNNLAASLFSRYQQIFDKNYPMPEDCYKGGDIIYFAEEFYKEYGDKFKGADYEENRMLFREFGRNIALREIKVDMERFGTWFDLYSSEQTLYDKNMVFHAINRLTHVYEKDGAKWLATTKGGYDDKDRVIVKSDGGFTYMCADIAYHEDKLKRTNDKNGIIIDVWGADHSGYVERIKYSMEDLGYNRNQCEMVLFQLLRVVKDGKEVKMSKRLGTSLTLRELMDEVGKDAIRFFLINRSYNSKIDFDINKVTEESEANAMFNIKYAYARASQLINKSSFGENAKANEYVDEIAIKLINELKKFPDLINTMATSYKVNLLPPYLQEITGLFNSFYSNSKIIGSELEERYIALVKATKTVLGNGLKLMDLDILEKM
ncbi:arginine--tRNA ligase [Mycoplasma phocoenae]|uniref:Arginine--tRNA ligase n=1 Tax=Mycoplasma phocoenae TaxID=754517 RepID=A0A858U3A6_9MOLU|nr:arginine--tRNA ligase [Mycoplasma phocoenae]QJG66902.1 arginine--tRNA ligase [Mycoplasma phocoenae]